MPNHTNNKVVITGADLKRFWTDATRSGEFEFSNIHPMPPYINEKKSDDPLMPAWYTWNMENYSTKWDCYNVEDVVISDGKIEFSYQTAWTPATNFWRYATFRYDISVIARYVDESYDWAGTSEFQKGEVKTVEVSEIGAVENFCKDYGFEYFEDYDD